MMSIDHHGVLDIERWEEIKSDWKPASPIRSSARRPNFLERLAKPFKPIMSLLWPVTMSTPGKPRTTAYLDGLRGFAAFLVYWHHHQLWVHIPTGQGEIFEDGFGFNNKYYLVAFHGIRTFFTGGHYAVSTFFVISGYVLSAKPLSLIHQREYVKLSDNVASALFRRWLRLYLPLIAVTFLYITSWHVFSLWALNAQPKGTWREEVWAWYAEFKNFSFLYNQGGDPWLSYQFHAWSIQLEFKGSVVIYTSLLAFSRLTKNARLGCELVLMFYFMYVVDGWYATMFISGMLLCDLDLLHAKNELPRALLRLKPVKVFIFYHLLAFSIYLGGVPSINADINRMKNSRGWYYLSYLKPQAVFDYKWFYLFWAATFLVASIPRIPWLKRFFETRFCQYLGRISFALYLVHGPVLWTLGDRLYTATGWYQEAETIHIPRWVNALKLPKAGPLGLEMSFLVPHLVLLPFTIWLAEIVTRVIDEPSIRFAQWVYRRLLPRPV
ncbi:acyltransferase family-domain-containing protein [Hypomontagnella submonticulosa]|nr:acyltransferase family-domain-containing protein [Hypomontagnella submonticulosa]